MLVEERGGAPFQSLDDLKRRVALTKEAWRTLAELGALNCFAEHRRAAMWRVEETAFDDLLGGAHDSRASSGDPPDDINGNGECLRRIASAPLQPMTMPERVKADYDAMNLTTGPHPMKLLRQHLPNIWRATDLASACHGDTVQIAGNVICRQRPGTAKGFVFVSLEDETGVSNAIVTPASRTRPEFQMRLSRRIYSSGCGS